MSGRWWSALLLWQKRFVACLKTVLCLPRWTWKFPFEYHYAVCCCMFAVILIQGTFFPALLPFGLLFFCIKHFSDTFVLLFGHAASTINADSGKMLREQEDELTQRTGESIP